MVNQDHRRVLRVRTFVGESHVFIVCMYVCVCARVFVCVCVHVYRWSRCLAVAAGSYQTLRYVSYCPVSISTMTVVWTRVR